MPTFLATFLTSRWILLVSSLIEYRLTFLTIQCYPELQGKTFWTLHVLLLSKTHSFLNWLSTLTCVGVTSPAIRLPHWRCLQSLSTHLREDILIIFLPCFSSTNRFLLFDASNSSWTLLKLLPAKIRLRYSDSSSDFSHRRSPVEISETSHPSYYVVTNSMHHPYEFSR